VTTSAQASGFSAVDVRLVVDGGQLAGGGLQRIVSKNDPPGIGYRYWSMSSTLSLSPGPHTIQVEARLSGTTGNFAGNAAATVSGDSSSVLQGQLSVLILRQ
jgi:hypothetical protein